MTAAPMTALEAFVADLNGLAFFREFTFSRSRFSPEAESELELADNIVWLERSLTILQLKERDRSASTDEIALRKWFHSKILKNAVTQIADSTKYLSAHPEIKLSNDHGHCFTLRASDIDTTLRIIVYASGINLPIDCSSVKHRVSSRSGFIHIMPVTDYLGVIRSLRVPCDVLDYFKHRQEWLERKDIDLASIEEPALLGHFLSGEQTTPSHEHTRYLEALQQDWDQFDLAPILADLHKHIEHTDNPIDYYKILQEFAALPRSVWREIKLRYRKCVDTAAAGTWTQPYKLSYPASGCAFMLYAVDPKMPNGTDRDVRAQGLTNLTMGAKYVEQMPRAVGITVSKDGEYFLVDWYRLDYPWEQDEEMDRRLAQNSPFRESSEKVVPRFRFSDGDAN